MAEEKKYTTIRFPKGMVSKPYTVSYEDENGETHEQTRVSIHVPEANGEFGAKWQSFTIAADRIRQDKYSDGMRYILMKPEREVKVSISSLDPQTNAWSREGDVIMSPAQIKDAFDKNLENFKNRAKGEEKAPSTPTREQTQEQEHSR